MTEHTETFEEDDHVNFEEKKVGRIVSAKYGGNSTFINVDVFVAGFLKPDGSLKFQVSNKSMRKDPLPYVRKKLILKYTDYVERNEKPPNEIKVENAGNNDVNGVYVPNGIQTIRKNRILTFRSITRALDYIGIFIMIISILHIKEFLFTNVNQIAEFHLLMDGLNTEMEVKQVICQL